MAKMKVLSPEEAISELMAMIVYKAYQDLKVWKKDLIRKRERLENPKWLSKKSIDNMKSEVLHLPDDIAACEEFLLECSLGMTGIRGERIIERANEEVRKWTEQRNAKGSI